MVPCCWGNGIKTLDTHTHPYTHTQTHTHPHRYHHLRPKGARGEAKGWTSCRSLFPRTQRKEEDARHESFVEKHFYFKSSRNVARKYFRIRAGIFFINIAMAYDFSVVSCSAIKILLSDRRFFQMPEVYFRAHSNSISKYFTMPVNIKYFIYLLYEFCL